MHTGLKLASLHSLAVDFVKTGQPAQMTKNLKCPKRPHFMDCTHLPVEKTYVSEKILGQLYDQVERIDFVPMFAAPFDERVLNAYHVDEAMLDDVRGIKKEYDAHIRRIMAQHEIKTEFEVWSTFVLQHDRTTNDFKFHEQIGQLSNALKDQFKALCWQKAGGKDFQRLGPFVAAMYKATAMEMSHAVQECGQFEEVGGRRKPLRTMTPEKMPLMSFPWLFPYILGKIAKNSEREADGLTTVDLAAAEERQDTLRAGQLKKSRVAEELMHTNDDLQTTGGITHRGEVLELFEHPAKPKTSENVDTYRGEQSPTMFATSSKSTLSSNKPSVSPASSGHELIDLSPGSFEDKRDARSMSLSSHSSDLASLNEGFDDNEEEESPQLSETNIDLLRKSFSDASSESNDAADFVDSSLSAESSYGAGDDNSAVRNGLGAEIVAFEGEMKEEERKFEGKHVKNEEMEEEEEEEEEKEKNESDDSDAEDEIKITFDVKAGLLNRLAQLCTNEHREPATDQAEAKGIDLVASSVSHGCKVGGNSKPISMPGNSLPSSSDGNESRQTGPKPSDKSNDSICLH
jgi:hypothetical protein